MPLLATAILAMTLMQGAEAAPTTPYTTLPNRLRSWFHLRQKESEQKPAKARRPSDRIKDRSWAESGWIITVKSDGFTGKVRCELYPRQMFLDGRISYADGALGLSHDFDADPSKIWFRVDSQPAKPWNSVYRDLHAKGLTVASYRTGYGKDDMLLIPEEEVLTASKVTLRLADENGRETFDISGFGAALASSKRVGCTEKSYTRRLKDKD